MQKKTKKIITEICRYLLGAVFVFSGFVKAIDPLGGAYKIFEYLSSFGLGSMAALDLPMSFGQAVLEFTVGVCLLLGVYRKRITLFALIIMVFMTPLTLYIAIKNPVTDCGCFGDALVISNWATFYKNIVLLAAAVWLFLNFRHIHNFFHRSVYLAVLAWIVIFIAGISIYSYINLPIIDFRPYSIGTNIKESMKIPENAPQPEYQITLIYSKNGINKEFTIDNYPKDDSTWVFVDSRSVVLKQGYLPPVHDFSITNTKGADITDEVLDNPSYTFLLIIKRTDEAKDNNTGAINRLYDFSKKYNYGFYAITASLRDDIKHWKTYTAADYDFCTADETTLKTIIRSNPGLLLIKDGTIINKWSGNFLPSSNLDRPLEDSPLGKQGSNHSFLKIFVALIIFALPLLYIHRNTNRVQPRHRSRHNRYIENINKKKEEEEIKHIKNQL
jgi:uncharacterized membrane protein YphA (DoxX/SURF4 family)